MNSNIQIFAIPGPTPVQITSVEPGDTDVGAKTSQLVIEYTTPDTGVEFKVEV